MNLEAETQSREADIQFVDLTGNESNFCSIRMEGKRASFDNTDTPNISVLFCGHINNTSIVIDELNESKSTQRSVNTVFDLVRILYQSNKLQSFLKKLDGNFLGVILDRSKRKVIVFNDRNGLKPFYFFDQGSRISISTDVSSIIKDRRISYELDKLGLDCFLKLGYLVGSRTLIKNVNLGKPAVIYEIDRLAQKSTVFRYWSFRQIQSNTLSFNDAVEQLYSVVKSAVQNRVRGEERLCISLSGGLDSRLLLAESMNHIDKDKIFCYTFGNPKSRDIDYASKVAGVAGIEHRKYNFADRTWLSQRLKSVFKTDGMLDIRHLHGVEFLQDISEGADVNLNGYLGDVIAGGGFVHKPSRNVNVRRVQIKRYYGEFSKYAEIDDPYVDFDTIEPALITSRFRRFTNLGLIAANEFIEQKTPFMDNLVMDWAFSVPQEYRNRNKVYSEMLKRFYPQYFQEIPWQKTGKLVSQTPKSAYTIMNKVAKRLVPFIANKDKNSEYANYDTLISGSDFDGLYETVFNKLTTNTELPISQLINSSDQFNISYIQKNDHYTIALRKLTLLVYFEHLISNTSRSDRAS